MKNKKTLSLIIALVLVVAVVVLLIRGDLSINQVMESLGMQTEQSVQSSDPVSTKSVEVVPDDSTESAELAEDESSATLPRDGVYTNVEDVALYLFTYQELPENFITKNQARDLGWPGGDLKPYAPGKTIGGDRFGNYEGLLPEKKGRIYYECDIDALGKSSRGAKRLVYSNDGLIFYTTDHYESFTQIFLEDLNAQR